MKTAAWNESEKTHYSVRKTSQRSYVAVSTSICPWDFFGKQRFHFTENVRADCREQRAVDILFPVSVVTETVIMLKIAHTVAPLSKTTVYECFSAFKN